MAVLLPDLMNRADIRMVESRGCLRLPLETSQRLGVSGDLVRQELQGDKTMQSGVLGLVHHTHAAATELLDDSVVRDGLADHAQACYGGSLSKSMKAMELAVLQQGQISKVPAFSDRARWRSEKLRCK